MPTTRSVSSVHALEAIQSSMPPKDKKLTPYQARNLSYVKPSAPNFLKALHAQVNGNRGPAGADDDEDGYEQRDPNRPAIPTRPRELEEQQDGEEQIDELEGAQVVVLKEGRHLTAEEVHKERGTGKPMTVWERGGRYPRPSRSAVSRLSD